MTDYLFMHKYLQLPAWLVMRLNYGYKPDIVPKWQMYHVNFEELIVVVAYD